VWHDKCTIQVMEVMWKEMMPGTLGC
jgi:hypothetical protein